MEGGVSYILYTYDLHHNFGRAPTVEKFNPLQLIFHNSNTGFVVIMILFLNSTTSITAVILSHPILFKSGNVAHTHTHTHTHTQVNYGGCCFSVVLLVVIVVVAIVVVVAVVVTYCAN